ncbi:MAG: MBL fold metallo-hydrolase [Ruminococcaceae bacterium]|nr:MBL fold metallo-hydrolase [Oscillospiraceae bacterium]
MKKLCSLILCLSIIILCFVGCTESDKASITTNPIADEKIGLAVHFIDIGQGDSTLLQSKGEFALIDGGEYSERDKLISYLSSQGVDELEFIISTHPHSDHCGGLSAVMSNFSTKTLICPDVDTDSNVWNYVLDTADERNVSFVNPSPKDEFQLGSATITILSPSADAVYSDLNDYSIVCKAEYGNTSFMLTGDAEKQVEKELLKSGFDLSSDILKCGHHGSSGSNSTEFIKAVNPSAAIISCGKNNDYGHPHTETLKRLEKQNIPVYRTDIDSTITVTSDGEQLYIYTKDYSGAELSTPKEITPDEYIGNKNSKVFHLPECSGVSSMSEKNKVFLKNREDAISKGYSPCGSCNP